MEKNLALEPGSHHSKVFQTIASANHSTLYTWHGGLRSLGWVSLSTESLEKKAGHYSCFGLDVC